MFYINPGEFRTKIQIQQPYITGRGVSEKTDWADIIEATADNPDCLIRLP